MTSALLQHPAGATAAAVTLQPVTLCGAKHVTADWFKACVGSWERLHGAQPWAVLSDGTLDAASIDALRAFNLDVPDPSDVRAQVEAALATRPNLLAIWRKHVLFRKLIEPAILFPQAHRILFSDTDVMFTRDVSVPEHESEFTFVTDDLCGYSAHWTMPLQRRIVVGLNSGFMVYAPPVVNFGLLEELVGRYITPLHPSSWWWAEQACWAALGGARPNPTVFDSRECLIMSGIRSRSAREIHEYRVKWLPQRRSVANLDEYRQLLDGASVIHFPGIGRDLISKVAVQGRGEPKLLRRMPARTATLGERLLLSARLGLRSWYKKR